jgi:DNA replicative helicase MCM subunit Mcm2 (Cdc46/Mcm family)
MSNSDIPSEIAEYVSRCVEGVEGTLPFSKRTVSLEGAYYSKVSKNYITGSGIVVKQDANTLSRKAKDNVAIRFSISDGHHSIDCIAHDANIEYLPGGKSPADLTEIMRVVDDSMKNGSRISFSGKYHSVENKLIFVVDTLQGLKNQNKSLMTEHQLQTFLTLCKKHKTSPLQLMLREDTLWGELYAKDYLKKAIMLFCLSPYDKKQMLHIGIVASVGEGKDHMIEKVVQPLVKCGMASSGKLCTIPGLFGAMNGDDINSIELGLIPKHNNERIAVSEFQTWNEEVFGELMNTMANGYFTMQKGQVDTRRDAFTNMLFLGNPPHYFDEDNHDKREMLAAFGEYTYQIVSRLTLIFTEMSLAGEDAEKHIRNIMLMDAEGMFDNGETKKAMEIWRNFFREYLAKVSGLDPKFGKLMPTLDSTFNEMKDRPQYQTAFLSRAQNDYRKYQEFINLVKSFAKLDGSDRITVGHLMQARQLFEKSLSTLTEEFPMKAMAAGVDTELLTVYEIAKADRIIYNTKADLKKISGMSSDQINKLISMGALDAMSDGSLAIRLDFDWEGGGANE